MNKTYPDWLPEAIALLSTGMSKRAIARELDIGRTSCREWLGQWEDGEVNVGGYEEPTVKKPQMKPTSNESDKDNSRVLLISDMHIPYHHPDLLPFLQYLKDKWNPTRVICLGDELDKHSLSYHDSDPDLPNAGDELKLAQPIIKELHKMFPVMDIIESNHGSLVWRKAKTHGIPRHYIKSYQDVLGVDDGWQWYFDLTITLPDGKQCYIHHGKTTDVTKLSQQMGMNAVQGHYHEKYKAEYWGNPNGLYWGLQSACLINDKSYAFSYNNVNIKRPVIGTSLIINSHPVLEPMVLNRHGRWVIVDNSTGT